MELRGGPEHLFVYGTLRPGFDHPMARRLARESRHLGPAAVAGILLDLGDYPALIPAAKESDRVYGDLLRLTRPAQTLIWLDEYEGCAGGEPPPHEYRRECWPVTCRGEIVDAWIYLLNRPARGLRRIASGDYLQRP